MPSRPSSRVSEVSQGVSIFWAELCPRESPPWEMILLTPVWGALARSPGPCLSHSVSLSSSHTRRLSVLGVSQAPRAS